MKITNIVVIMLSVALVACSNKQVYESIRYNKKIECQELPLPKYDECMAQLGTSYEEYKAEEEELNSN